MLTATRRTATATAMGDGKKKTPKSLSEGEESTPPTIDFNITFGMGAVCVRRYRTQTVQIFDYLYTKRTMDKFGWQRPMIPSGMTGIQ